MKGIISLFAACFFFMACQPKTENHLSNIETQTIYDQYQRKVEVPKTINRIIAIKTGALRLVSYLECAHQIVGIENYETKSMKPYNMAFPFLAQQPIIGQMHGGNPELIMLQKPDVIIMSYANKQEADLLQQKTNIPVVGITYGNLEAGKDDLYKSIKLLGKILNKKKRADSLVIGIEAILTDIKQRSDSVINSTAFIGGVSKKGTHGIGSTEPSYAAFEYLRIKNVAAQLPTKTNTIIDTEKLMEWQPDYIFIDHSGLPLVQEELQRNKALSNLKAFQKRQAYVVWPHNMYNVNFSSVLINLYFIGKVVRPQTFHDINLEKKSAEIFQLFFKQNLLKQMQKNYGKQRALNTA